MGNTNSPLKIRKDVNKKRYGLNKNTSKAFCVCTVDTNIFYTNQHFVDLFKCDKNQLLGQSLNQSPKQQPHFGMKSKKAFELIKQMLNKATGTFSFSWLFSRPNKELFWARVDVLLAKLHDNIVCRCVLTEIPNPTLEDFIGEDLPGRNFLTKLDTLIKTTSFRQSSDRSDMLLTLRSLTNHLQELIIQFEKQKAIERKYFRLEKENGKLKSQISNLFSSIQIERERKKNNSNLMKTQTEGVVSNFNDGPTGNSDQQNFPLSKLLSKNSQIKILNNSSGQTSEGLENKTNNGSDQLHQKQNKAKKYTVKRLLAQTKTTKEINFQILPTKLLIRTELKTMSVTKKEDLKISIHPKHPIIIKMQLFEKNNFLIKFDSLQQRIEFLQNLKLMFENNEKNENYNNNEELDSSPLKRIEKTTSLGVVKSERQPVLKKSHSENLSEKKKPKKLNFWKNSILTKIPKPDSFPKIIHHKSKKKIKEKEKEKEKRKEKEKEKEKEKRKEKEKEKEKEKKKRNETKKDENDPKSSVNLLNSKENKLPKSENDLNSNNSNHNNKHNTLENTNNNKNTNTNNTATANSDDDGSGSGSGNENEKEQEQESHHSIFKNNNIEVMDYQQLKGNILIVNGEEDWELVEYIKDDSKFIVDVIKVNNQNNENIEKKYVDLFFVDFNLMIGDLKFPIYLVSIKIFSKTSLKLLIKLFKENEKFFLNFKSEHDQILFLDKFDQLKEKSENFQKVIQLKKKNSLKEMEIKKESDNNKNKNKIKNKNKNNDNNNKKNQDDEKMKEKEKSKNNHKNKKILKIPKKKKNSPSIKTSTTIHNSPKKSKRFLQKMKSLSMSGHKKNENCFNHHHHHHHHNNNNNNNTGGDDIETNTSKKRKRGKSFNQNEKFLNKTLYNSKKNIPESHKNTNKTSNQEIRAKRRQSDTRKFRKPLIDDEDSIEILIFFEEEVFQKAIFTFLGNGNVSLKTSNFTYFSNNQLEFKLINHPTKRKFSKLIIDTKKYLIKFHSGKERNKFSKRFIHDYESKKAIFQIVILLANYKGERIKKRVGRIGIRSGSLTIQLQDNQKLVIPILKILKILNHSKKNLLKLELLNDEYFMIAFLDNERANKFLEKMNQM
ncbi:hypothetical protein M0813_28345 [Anaeramoeba flamelloides]|uniref:PAS domain-containing protein n=1 Tax=Anaeramoeba flamelloides TaxID=1746091 RepID=A0ABQ8XT91_9EUKA|nr:hypothetical protein M0813_28345 [Anaeramoeba flamelloides]